MRRRQPYLLEGENETAQYWVVRGKFIYILALVPLSAIIAVLLAESFDIFGSRPILYFFEGYIVPDRKISKPEDLYFQLLMILTWIELVLIFCYFLAPRSTDFPMIQPKLFYGFVIVIFVMSVVAEQAPERVPRIFLGEDGISEILTVLLVLSASLLLLRSLWVCLKNNAPLVTCAAIAGLSLVTLLFVMEEISWGQRIVGWNSPQFFKEHNFQEETNVHNFFNPYIPMIYQTVAFIVATVLVMMGSHRMRMMFGAGEDHLAGLVPERKYTYLAFIVILAGKFNETFEVVMSIFIVSYSLDVWRYYRSFGRSRTVSGLPR